MITKNIAYLIMGQNTLIEKENMLQNKGGFCSREMWALYSYI
jgi:hypothetical protein